jgi:hypothetical protein
VITAEQTMSHLVSRIAASPTGVLHSSLVGDFHTDAEGYRRRKHALEIAEANKLIFKSQLKPRRWKLATQEMTQQ